MVTISRAGLKWLCLKWVRRLRRWRYNRRPGKFSFYERFILRTSVCGTYGSIRFVSLLIEKKVQEEEFVAFAKDALALIQRVDTRTFRLIEREIAYLVSAYITSGGRYHRRHRKCLIDFAKWRPRLDRTSPEYEWWVASIAATIVHEATHGRILSWGIPYNKTTWARVERLCVLQEQRFAARLLSAHYDLKKVVRPFEPSRWTYFSNPKQWRRDQGKLFARMWRDTRESSRRTK